jgi:hypothetical protein
MGWRFLKCTNIVQKYFENFAMGGSIGTENGKKYSQSSFQRSKKPTISIEQLVGLCGIRWRPVEVLGEVAMCKVANKLLGRDPGAQLLPTG